MKILLWTKHPGDILGEAIQFATHGPAQHAGFLRGNGLVHEAYFPQVRDRALTEQEKPFVQVFSLAGITPEQEAKFERWFDASIKLQTQYSIADLFRFAFNIPFPDEQHTICSRYVYRCCQAILPDWLWPLVRTNDDQVSPRDLYISPFLKPASLA